MRDDDDDDDDDDDKDGEGLVGGLVSAVARMRHDDLDGGAVESHGGGGRTAAASYASFRRTTIPCRAAATARRWDAHDDVDVNVATLSGTTNASTDGGTMPTANGGKWLSFVDVAIDKGSTTTNIAMTATATVMVVNTRRSFLHGGGGGVRPTE